MSHFRFMLPYSAFVKEEKNFAKGQFRRVYGVLGDAHLQSRVVESLLGHSLDADARDFNLDVVSGNDATVADVLALAGNLPFLAERRVVVVSEIEKLENIGKTAGTDDEGGEEEAPRAEDGDASPRALKTSNAAKTFGEALRKIAPTTILILRRTPETPDINARKKVRRLLNATLDKIIEGKDGGEGLIVDCTLDPKDSGSALKMVEDEAAARGVRLQGGVARFLVERCGTDIQQLLGELEKCELSAGGAMVTTQIVEEMTRPALHNTTFDLIDAISEKRGAQALALTRQMFDFGIAPEQMLGQLVSHLRQLMQARGLQDAGVQRAGDLKTLSESVRRQFPAEGFVTLLNNPGQSWRAGKLMNQSRRFSTLQLQGALEMSLDADLAFKGIQGDGGFESRNAQKASFEILLARLCA